MAGRAQSETRMVRARQMLHSRGYGVGVKLVMSGGGDDRPPPLLLDSAIS